MTVWVDGWQLDCCGEPFQVRSQVAWRLRPNNGYEWLAVVLGPESAIRVEATEDHHGGVGAATRGTVTAIEALYCRFTPEPVARSGLLVEVDAAQKWIPDRGDRRFAGFVVRLSPHQI